MLVGEACLAFVEGGIANLAFCVVGFIVKICEGGLADEVMHKDHAVHGDGLHVVAH